MLNQYVFMGMRNQNQDFITERTELRGNKNIRIGKFFCYLNGKTYSTIRGLMNAIRPMTVKEFYDVEYKKENEGFCEVCGKETVFHGLIKGYSKYCLGCHSKTEEHKEIVKNRFLGDDEKKNIALKRQKETTNKKTTETLKEIQDKRVSTLKAHYGENYFSDKAKKQWERRTIEEKRSIAQKATATKIKNGTIDTGGFANSNKRMILDGKEFFYQGYEGIVIEMLVNNFGFSVDEILTGKKCPRVKYEGNVSGYYRPDIFIPSLNLYVEVKSFWTYWGKPDFLKVNLEKQKATINSNHHHIIFIVNSVLLEKDILDFEEFLSMIISSQESEMIKVQRLEGDSSYRSIAIGSGSAKHPKWMVI